ncbi:MAG: photosystem reaction center subunit H [Firmicutes bacterium]|nr:photosystem reaction center subunit H [Bacillota bacterium]
MKTSKEIISLPVLSIAEVAYLGVVKDLLINPGNGTVDFVVVEQENSFESKLVPFDHVVGIGEDALTVKSQNTIIPFSSSGEAVELQEKNVKVINAKVMTEKGTIVGRINEIMVDEETGRIVGCQWVPSVEQEQGGYIPTSHVITLGREMIIVDKDFKEFITDEVSPEDSSVLENQAEQDEDDQIEQITENTSEDPLKFFEGKQKEYLIGRKVTATITTDDGEIIAEEGDIVTPETIERATEADKYIDLTMNTVDES